MDNLLARSMTSHGGQLEPRVRESLVVAANATTLMNATSGTTISGDLPLAFLYLATRVHFTLMSYWEPTFALICIVANVRSKSNLPSDFLSHLLMAYGVGRNIASLSPSHYSGSNINI